MLVIQRKPDASILVDGKVEITVLKIGENSVKLGITAPKDISVERGENTKEKNE